MEKMTPMIAQYRRIKQQQPGAILLFRVGDFYETFFDDAALTAKALGIVLTSRNHGKGQDVPLAGIPHHALERYVTRLIKAGHKVAICDQVEDPKLAKGIVRREVTEVITPGTIMRASLLDDRKENLLAGLFANKANAGAACGLALCDLSTGSFRVAEISKTELADELRRNAPAEILIPAGQAGDLSGALAGYPVTRQDDYRFEPGMAEQKLLEHFKTKSLAGFGCEDMPLAVGAAGAVLRYLEENQKTVIGHIARLAPYRLANQMLLDGSTIRNLNLLPDQADQTNNLLSVIDLTLTAMGGRLLRRWLMAPLLEIGEIKARQDAVQALTDDRERLARIRGILKQVQDVERLLSRIVCQRAGPRDLAGLAASLELVPSLKRALPGAPYFSGQQDKLGDFTELCGLVKNALIPEPPPALSQGGFIKTGYSAELDGLKALAGSDKAWIASRQQVERERTGIGSLKVGYNSVFGYYIEVSQANLGLVPEDYIRRQTLANAERFITPELKAYEDKVLGAEERIKQLELALFAELRQQVSGWSKQIATAAEALAALDAISALAELAAERGYVRPVVDDKSRIAITGGRHPVVERNFQLGQFIPNDARLDDEQSRLIILTGPNMAGKSTFLRQTALIVILAQIGSFVPAASAAIGIVDRIFTRIGASDDLAKGVSTFLAEMNETANILDNATARSLVLLDEIGRGTSTFDGLSIAWAVSEHLHDRIGCKTLFATHYHELTELALWMPGVKNFSMAVREWGEEIIFLRTVVPGAAGQSYGVQVARLAGLPVEVIARAREVLHNLESEQMLPDNTPRLARHQALREPEPQPDLFEVRRSGRGALLEEIRRLTPEAMTPLEALTRLAKLKELAGKED
ncbi:MAG: DNA mismatch repair protein MutS [Candidatus Edwardsbacteria bacterium]|nr:DNA mismatch repair protein MutS [Candidatus Edwardsbacteria bacterium]